MIARILPFVAVALTLAACGGPYDSVFVVLPDPDGRTGSVTVDDGTSTLTLDEPYATGAVRDGRVRRVDAAPEDVDKAFAAALAALPTPPAHFSLFFKLDSEALTSDSEAVFADIVADAGRRPVYRIEVIGHTDTKGDAAYNATLSLARAKAVASRLVRAGLDQKSIKTSGRGERDLAVPTADEVDEPRNRRVEIDVR